MTETIKERLKKLKKNGNLIDVSTSNDKTLQGVIIKGIKNDTVQFFQPKSGQFFNVHIPDINYFDY